MGRIGSGALELVASILILVPPTVWIGSILAIGLMAGAILSHITVIGIFRDDGGQLFFYAVCGIPMRLVFILEKQKPASGLH